MLGNMWSKIAGMLPGRSSNCVKNRWCWLARHLPEAEAPETSEETAQLMGWEHPSTERPFVKVDPDDEEEEDFIWI
jgi:hypothetical protein